MTLDPMPALTFDEAQQVGAALHDHLVLLTGQSPFEPGDLGLADTVQFIARKARERVAQREMDDGR
jgi:hypothetical protein